MHKINQRIIAVHLLNDFSGSPMVLRQSLEVLKLHAEIHLYTATPTGNGVLSNLTGIHSHPIYYKWHPNKVVTLFYFIWAQIMLFKTLLFFLKKEDTVYINTLLPFAAALAGYLVGAKVVYHVHEVSISPAFFKNLLVNIAKRFSTQLIFVSKYVKTNFKAQQCNSIIIYNALPTDFLEQASIQNSIKLASKFTLLMLCSAKKYKGINEFVELAKRLPSLNFTLVLNATKAETNAFKNAASVPSNCEVYPVQKNTTWFYQQANLVVNFSKPKQWVETFGLTILEGMAYGLPSIVPPIGGITELVTDGVEGLHIDIANIEQVSQAIVKLSANKDYYNKLSVAAKKKAENFSQKVFSEQIVKIFTTQITQLTA